MDEFQLIRSYFQPDARGEGVVLGVGDDAALLQPAPGQLLVTCVDTLVAGVHFPEDAPPDAVGHKALAVNLSDLAAMGARPRWFQLALTLPEIDEAWLAAFSSGLHRLAAEQDVALVGGDTTRGPLTITVQAMGEVAPAQALRRTGARAGDRLYVTGTLGDAAQGLALWQRGVRSAGGDDPAGFLIDRLHRPTPRMAAGRAAAGLARAAIDISDGLLADLGHLLEGGEGLGAVLQADSLPLSPAYRAHCEDSLPGRAALSGGDDYELLFAVAPENEAAFQTALQHVPAGCTCIGWITEDSAITLQGDGKAQVLTRQGYQHFN
ncbi:thiamine-phosphate kinase [Alkalilimnicola ehrlichii MLHE-1]|uniref:Thiamine-monophosphate kinase n=1 Tax=Alkalilimnicola ehrlichii (strain ATCC BAA-1101 / DSM 17681 / MLHE-1) TaxID=187272 RepID=Q0ABQ2_ALKEH|nr:thiamine-phosphate kinase [Alkalilimnicola ehrlichii]ABI55735.1 thiamine-phosphate kinase [Alkalilimnicola ehrlichii MLHE-1]